MQYDTYIITILLKSRQCVERKITGGGGGVKLSPHSRFRLLLLAERKKSALGSALTKKSTKPSEAYI